MDQPNSKKEIATLIYFFLFICFITGLIFSLRAVSSISTGLMLLTGLIVNKSFFRSLSRQKNILFFLSASLIFTLLQIVSLLYTKNKEEGVSNIIVTSSVFITPFAICSTGYLDSQTSKRTLQIFCVLLAIASLYCLVIAAIRYTRRNDPSLFFYHQLAHAIKQHAVYFSILVFTAIVFCGESIRENKKEKFTWYPIAMLYFSAFLFFLSSKLVIVFFVIYVLYFLVNLGRKKTLRPKASSLLIVLTIITTCFALFTQNPINKRFTDIFKGDIATLNKDQYSSGDYFNGLQFRLLQWRMAPEILNETRSWIAGVSPGDAQDKLNEKYISKKMYAGDPNNNDRGYLLYNTHNQFLQSLLGNGIIGLFVFLILIFSILKMTCQHKKPNGMFFVIALLLAFTFTESVLKTQYGIIIFTFLPLLIFSYCRDDQPA